MRKMFAFALAIIMGTNLSYVGASAAPATQDAPPVDVRALERQALASLLAGYEVLISGTSKIDLVPQTDSFGVYLSGVERAAKILNRRAMNARYGSRFTAAHVVLTDVSVEPSGGRVLIRALEQVELPFVRSDRAADPDRDATGMRIPHVFTFAYEGGSWVLEHDQAGGFRDGGPAPQLPGPAPAQAEEPTSTTGVTRVASSPLTASALAIADPSGLATPNAIGVAAYGTYNRNAAGDYAYNWAYGRNPNYGDYTNVGGDCTNFASQALEAGGWQYKLGWYKDWNNWWHSTDGDTESWTYVPAMKQFVYTSGRGQALSYLSQLLKGDMMQVDFGGNGSWDHTAIVDSRYSSSLGDIYVSYHTEDTRHRSIADFLSEVPIPPNQYMAWNIVATTN